METDELFNRTKIKMVMRLRGVSHDEAVELIKNGKAAAQKKACEDKDRSSEAVNTNAYTNDDPEILSAEEFFKDID